MDLTLRRYHKVSDGVFSYLLDASGQQIAVSCTHAYQDDAGDWEPKTPPGRYLCVRGEHALAEPAGGIWRFETFEITGVPGHSGLLFHPGNTELDSEGCECLGTAFGGMDAGGRPLDAVLNSRVAFAHFMLLQNGCNRFWLTVEDAS